MGRPIERGIQIAYCYWQEQQESVNSAQKKNEQAKADQLVE
jgi:hypothetical protein